MFHSNLLNRCLICSLNKFPTRTFMIGKQSSQFVFLFSLNKNSSRGIGGERGEKRFALNCETLNLI
jgi:hypothetical protein